MEGAVATPMENIISALGTGFTSIATNVTSVLTTIIPIALGIVGMVWVVRKGVGWFKSLSK